jgi:hypothetical protein
LSGGAPEAAAPAAAAAPATGRLIEKSAALDLGVPANHLQPVAGRVVAITAQLGGIIDSSNVNDTGGADGGAQFALRVPSAQLETALARLSQIPNAHLRSRSDSSQDINAPFVSARRRLATATAERRALLRALANATTQSRIDALKAQIAATDRTIAITGAEVRALQRRASFSRIALQIEATAASHGGGAALDPGSGLRTAAKVLGAAIAVALVGLAAIAPLALVLTVAWGAAFALRRRRRERALGPA